MIGEIYWTFDLENLYVKSFSYCVVTDDHWTMKKESSISLTISYWSDEDLFCAYDYEYFDFHIIWNWCLYFQVQLIPANECYVLTLKWPRWSSLGYNINLFFAHFTTFACAFFDRYFV